jgi:asparagine synthase (glutamine-hydrolysing)
MCGIAGLYNFKSGNPVNFNTVERMVSALNHRGPDECGFLIDNNFGMGMSRLSIIDLSSGTQPLHNEDKTKWIVFNGEIFNYLELRQELIKKGHEFKTHSDTEVIVHMYEEYGNDFLKYLNGQFAISIWDTRKKSLIIARDRVGIRPLFYSIINNKSIAFSSEIKAIFAGKILKPEVEEKGIAEIFTYWVNIPPTTAFKNVMELPAGHFILCDENGVRIKKYWSLEFPENGDFYKKSVKEVTEELKELIDDAASLRLRADVPVAAYLSGGIDSSVITSLVKKFHNNELITFSVAFKEAGFDERYFQKKMVEHIGTDHRMVEVNNNDIAKDFIDVVWYAEKPMMRTAPAPLFALSRLVRENNIKVVLTGEGADEIFGGYNIFKEDKVRRFWAEQPGSSSRALLLSRLYPYILKSQNAVNPFWQAFFKKGLEQTDNPLYSHLIRWDNTSKTKVFFNDDIKKYFPKDGRFPELENFINPNISKWHPLNKAQYLETTFFMSGYLLSSQGDRMMMGNSVEGRFPYLDHRVIEYAAKLPPEMKIKVLTEKFILKKSFEDILPEIITNRPKQPYRAPIVQCFLTDKTPELIRELLSTQKLKEYGYFNPSSANRLIEQMKVPGKNISAKDDMALAAMVSVQLLHYHYIENFDNHIFRLAEKQTYIDLNKN